MKQNLNLKNIQNNMTEFNSYFNRQIQLWGEDTQQLLQSKKIAIIGCGGLGCSSAIALGASGIGHIDLVDFDDVSIHNIHRQIAFTLADENSPKAEVVVEVMKSKNPFVKAKAYCMDFEEFKLLGNRYDLILDATDNLQTRESIDYYAKQINTPWIYGSVEAFNGQVCFFEKAKFEDFFKITSRFH